MTPQLRGGSLDRIFDMGAGLGVHHASFLAVPILDNVVASSEAPTAQSMLLARATASTGQDRGEMPPYLLKEGRARRKFRPKPWPKPSEVGRVIIGVRNPYPPERKGLEPWRLSPVPSSSRWTRQPSIVRTASRTGGWA